MSLGGAAASGAAAIATKSNPITAVASIAVPLLLSLFGGKKASPQSAAQTTAQQAQAALNSIPPELRNLLNIQAQNAQAAQPLYLAGLNATNQLLPAWARSGGTMGTPTRTATPAYEPLNVDAYAQPDAPKETPGLDPQTVAQIVGLMRRRGLDDPSSNTDFSV